MVIRKSVLAFRGLDFQVSASETFISEAGLMGSVGIVSTISASLCVATSLPDLLETISGLAVEFPKLMVLGDFNLASLGLASKVTQEFVATMEAVDLSPWLQFGTHTRYDLVGATAV